MKCLLLILVFAFSQASLAASIDSLSKPKDNAPKEQAKLSNSKTPPLDVAYLLKALEEPPMIVTIRSLEVTSKPLMSRFGF